MAVQGCCLICAPVHPLYAGDVSAALLPSLQQDPSQHLVSIGGHPKADNKHSLKLAIWQPGKGLFWLVHWPAEWQQTASPSVAATTATAGPDALQKVIFALLITCCKYLSSAAASSTTVCGSNTSSSSSNACNLITCLYLMVLSPVSLIRMIQTADEPDDILAGNVSSNSSNSSNFSWLPLAGRYLHLQGKLLLNVLIAQVGTSAAPLGKSCLMGMQAALQGVLYVLEFVGGQLVQYNSQAQAPGCDDHCQQAEQPGPFDGLLAQLHQLQLQWDRA